MPQTTIPQHPQSAALRARARLIDRTITTHDDVHRAFAVLLEDVFANARELPSSVYFAAVDVRHALAQEVAARESLAECERAMGDGV